MSVSKATKEKASVGRKPLAPGLKRERVTLWVLPAVADAAKAITSAELGRLVEQHLLAKAKAAGKVKD